MLNSPFSPWPSFTEEEADAVAQVIRSNRVNYWTGTESRKFETEFAAFADSSHAVALANGTLALDVALKALDIGSGDDVIVTPRSFIASVSCVVTAGATPVFADVDRNTQALSAETIEAVLTPATRAVIVVHLGGMPADMDPIMALADKHGFKVIEDCAQAHGARYGGRSAGAIGHIAAWSFCQDKIMTTGGEGGMVTTNDETLRRRMWEYKDHGKSWEAVYERKHPPGFRWLHESFGTNWRMLEMQAVIGRIQLRRMKEWQARRLANAERIWNALRPHDWARVPTIQTDKKVQHAAYRAYAFVQSGALPTNWTRDSIVEYIVAAGVPCFQGSCSEIYNEKAFDGTGWRPASPLPVARELGETSLMFLTHPTLTDAEMDKTVAAIDSVAAAIAGDKSAHAFG